MKDSLWIVALWLFAGFLILIQTTCGYAMDSNFKQSLKSVLVHEGGWSDHNKDPGGSTMKGVTLTTYRTIYGQDKTKNELKNITDEELHNIYYNNYWLKASCDKLPLGVDYAVFDAAVNSGPRRARRWLQEAAGVSTDGIIGPKTLKAIEQIPEIKLIDTIIDTRLRFMQNLSIWKYFGKGWKKRIDRVRSTSIKMHFKER